MKIAFLIQDLFGRGAEYATALLVRGFVAEGYQVDLILSQVHKDKLGEGLRPFDIPETTNVVYLGTRRARYNIPDLRHYLRTTDAAAVVVMSVGYESAVLLASLGLAKRPRLYTVKHTIDFALDANHQYRQPNNSWLARLRDKIHFSCFDGVLCVAERVRTEMIRQHHLPVDRVHTVYNPAVEDGFMARCKLPPKHPWLVNKGYVPTFIAAGAFQSEKGHLCVMEAFMILNKTRRARLIIYGRGELEETYKKYIREHKLEEVVSLPGFTNQLPAEIAASDGYISSSEIESFGIAIVEGLACGVPVISTDAPCGPREVLGDGMYGQLVPPNDAQALAEAVIRVVDCAAHPAVAESWKRFSLKRIVALYETALKLSKGANGFQTVSSNDSEGI